MSGRHRDRRFRAGLPAIALVAMIGAAGWAFRGDLATLLRGEEPAAPAEPVAGRSPAATLPSATAPSPAPVSSPEATARRRLVVQGTGDVNLDPGYIPNLAARGYGFAWSGLEGLFRRDDLTIVNLECAVSNLGMPVPKEFNFRCDPDALPAMREAGVEVANLANNHSGDFGPDALLDSVRSLRRAGVRPVGVGRDERRANRPAVLERRGWRIAVLGFGGVVPAPDWLAGPSHPGMADGDDIDSMAEAVRAAKRRADLVFVSIHWGAELDSTPRSEDVERARAMIDAGADAIFGHHAHRLQPLEHYRGKPVFWGLGNFVWPNFSEAGSTTAVAEVVVTRGGKVRGRLLPAFIEDAGHPVLRR